MTKLSPRPITYRHVVFPGAPEWSGRALNFSPQAPVRDLSPDLDELSLDEHACLRWVFEQAGLELSDYRSETIRRRLPACLRALRVASIGQLRHAVQREPQLLKRAVGTLVIGVTGFFRDPQVFSALERTVIPDVLARSAGPRVWSVGCSDGAELYSLGILLAERGALQRSTLLGTDCRPDAIAQAKQGCYDAAAVRNVSPALLDRYFARDLSAWRVHPYLRAILQWRGGNVMATLEPGSWDLILCRNMAIYMQPSAAIRLWSRLEQCLRPGGMLVLGKAERPMGVKGLRAIAPSVYRREVS